MSLWDELSGSFWTRHSFSVSWEIFDIAFIPKNYSYIESWNNFGDCTSLNKNLQIDESKNIFWTTASWLFDPFYQILQVESHGQPIMKIHLVLMQFKWRIILCIDAIETVPSMREFKTNQEREWIENQWKSHFFEHRHSIIEQSIQVVYALAERLWIDTVLAEEYSNTTWVRTYLSKYEQVIFDISQLHQLFDGDVLEYILRNEWLDVGGIKTEIQLRNTELQDKWFKPHLNSGRLLKWSIKSVPNWWRWI